jgi:hypothetical protein
VEERKSRVRIIEHHVGYQLADALLILYIKSAVSTMYSHSKVQVVGNKDAFLLGERLLIASGFQKPLTLTSF